MDGQLGLTEFKPLNLSHTLRMHIFNEVQFISESPHFYMWNFRGRRELIGDKLNTGVVPVPAASSYGD